MEFSSLFRRGTDSARKLKNMIRGSVRGGSSGKGGTDHTITATAETESNSTADFNKYLLSDLHLDISILSSGEQNDTKLQFSWYAKEITDIEISIQVLF